MNIFELILPIALAGSPPSADTCAMASKTIQSMTAFYITSPATASSSSMNKFAHKKRKEILAQIAKSQVENVKNFQMKKATVSAYELNQFSREPRFLSYYRIRNEKNPCDQLDKKTYQLIYRIQQDIKNQCLSSTNPFQKIVVNKSNWSSEGFIQEGQVFIGTQCSPTQNTSELFFNHAVANAYDVSVERLCRSAWSGLLSAWSDTKQCISKGRWYDLNAWSNGKIVNVSPPSSN